MVAGVDWRRNLTALWFAQFTAIFGFSFAFPFIPLYLKQLGVQGEHDLAFWTGLAGGASGLALAAISPVWGAVADRYGRKNMLLRAMLGGAITVGLIGFAMSPIQLVALRLVQGLSSGTVAAATAIVAAGTPRPRVGWALGVLTSSIAVGGAIGPAVGGIAAGIFGLRAIFIAGGVLLAVASVPVILLVHEAPIVRGTEPAPRALGEIRKIPGGLKALTVLIISAGLVQSSFSGFQPLLVIKLINFIPNGAETVTGLIFGVSGLASSIAALSYSTVAGRIGYLWTGVACASLLAMAEVLTGFAPSVAVVFLGAGLAGLFYGAASPTISSMTGLECPPGVQARVFGFNASTTSLGFAIGPLVGGGLAATFGVTAGLLTGAVFALGLAILLRAAGREPPR